MSCVSSTLVTVTDEGKEVENGRLLRMEGAKAATLRLLATIKREEAAKVIALTQQLIL